MSGDLNRKRKKQDWVLQTVRHAVKEWRTVISTEAGFVKSASESKREQSKTEATVSVLWKMR